MFLQNELKITNLNKSKRTLKLLQHSNVYVYYGSLYNYCKTRV